MLTRPAAIIANLATILRPSTCNNNNSTGHFYTQHNKIHPSIPVAFLGTSPFIEDLATLSYRNSASNPPQPLFRATRIHMQDAAARLQI